MSKLLSSTATSAKAFDNLNLQVEGTTLTFREFSNIASNDVFKALDILSGNFDKLAQNRDVMAQLFTTRHWTKIAPILQDINGNTQEWVDTIVTGKSAQQAFEVQMNSLANQAMMN